MALSAIVWFVLIQNGLLAIGAIIFAGIMIKNYSKKKTMGTALLAAIYVFVAIRQIVGIVFNTYGAVNPYSRGQAIALLTYLLSFVLIYYFLYLFGSRHILQDNDVVRGIVSIVYLGIISAFIGIMGYELLAGVPSPIFTEQGIEPGTNLELFMPTTFTGILMYGLVLVLVQIRYIISLSVSLIRQKSIDPIRRIGTKYILAAVITLFFDVILTVAFTLEGLTTLVIIFLYLTRFILTMLSLFLSYIGWILPDWFRKRARRKAWIVKELATTRKPTATFYTSTTYTKEVNE
ncbi:MAG: hypothetical protein ACFFDW_13785 [Candidatus Thorarchaeota archaeon]